MLKTEAYLGYHLPSLPGSKSNQGSPENNYTRNTNSSHSKFAAIYQNLLLSAPSARLKVKGKEASPSKAAIGTDRLVWPKTKAKPDAASKVDQSPEECPVVFMVSGELIPAGNKAIHLTASTGNQKTGEQKFNAGDAKGLNNAQFSNRTAMPLTADLIQLARPLEQIVGPVGEKGVSRSQAQAAQEPTVAKDDLKQQLARPLEQKVGPGGEASRVTTSPAQSLSTGTITKVDDHFGYLESQGKPIKASAADASTGMEPNAMDLKQLVSLGKTGLEGPQMAAEKASMSNSQIDLIVNHMAAQIKGGASRVEIHLQPEYLGKIQILVQSNESLISVQILTQTGETLNLLNANWHHIKEAIEQQGIKLNEVSIDLADQEMQDNRSGHGYPEESQVDHSYGEARNIYDDFDNKGTQEQHYSDSYNLLNILA